MATETATRNSPAGTVQAPQSPPRTEAQDIAASRNNQRQQLVESGQPFGEAPGGQLLTTDSPEVQAELKRFPGLTPEAAIGNVAMRQPSPVVATSDKARKETEENKKFLDDTKKQAEDFAAQQQAQENQLDAITEENIPGIAAVDAEVEQIQNEYDKYMAHLDENARGQVNDIKREYAALRRDMRQTNAAIQGTINIAGFRTGRARYAPEVQAGILGAEIRAGQQRISDLIQEEQSLIRQAESAAAGNRWKAFNDMINLVRGARREKNELIKAHRDSVIQAAKEERERMKFAFDVMDAERNFALEVESKGFDRALAVAKQNGVEIAFNPDGSYFISKTPTFDRMSKEQTLKLRFMEFEHIVDRDEKKRELDLLRHDLAVKGYNLNVSRLNQEITEFGMNYALKQEELRMEQQDALIKRVQNGLPASQDELLGLAGPELIEQAIGNAIATAFPQNEIGGECGVFAHNLVDFPPVGNKRQEKFDTVNRLRENPKNGASGLLRDEWIQSGIAVGDVIITDGSDVSSGRKTTWGHVAVVNSVNPDGTVTLTESNTGNKGLVTNDRILRSDHPAIHGAIRGKIKAQYMKEAVSMTQRNMLDSIRGLAASPQFSGEAGPFLDRFDSIMAGTNDKLYERNKDTLQRHLMNGDTAKADRFLEDLVVRNVFTATQQEKHFFYGEVEDSTNFILNDLLSDQNIGQGGIYKDIFESTKKFATVSRDPEFAELKSSIELIQSQIRSDLYGSALTETEKEMADAFLINFRKDTTKDIRIKVNGLNQFFSEIKKKRIFQAQGIDYKLDLQRFNKQNVSAAAAAFDPDASISENQDLFITE